MTTTPNFETPIAVINGFSIGAATFPALQRAAAQIAIRHPIAIPAMAGAAIGIGATVLVCRYGPRVARFTRKTLGDAQNWAAARLTRTATPAATAPTAPASSVIIDGVAETTA